MKYTNFNTAANCNQYLVYSTNVKTETSVVYICCNLLPASNQQFNFKVSIYESQGQK